MMPPEIVDDGDNSEQYVECIIKGNNIYRKILPMKEKLKEQQLPIIQHQKSQQYQNLKMGEND